MARAGACYRREVSGLRAATLVAVVLLAAGCGESEAVDAESCLQRHPRQAGPAPDPLSVTAAVEACESGPSAIASGRDCNPDHFISEPAAVCIARGSGLAKGLGPIQSVLLFNTAHARIAWSVTNVTYDRPQDGLPGDSGGQIVDVDAITGALLWSGDWVRLP